MPDTKRRMGINGEHWRQTTIGSLATAIVTIAGMVGYFQVNPVRDDPFTGRQANELRRELEGKLADQKKSCEQRLAVIERRDEQLGAALNEVWRTIEALPPDTFENRVDELAERVRALEIYTVKHDTGFKPHE